jgi:hypothetical protein
VTTIPGSTTPAESGRSGRVRVSEASGGEDGDWVAAIATL